MADLPEPARTMIRRLVPESRLRFVESFRDDESDNGRSYTAYFADARATSDAAGRRGEAFYRPPFGPRGDPVAVAAEGPALDVERGVDLDDVPPAVRDRLGRLASPDAVLRVDRSLPRQDYPGRDPDARMYDFLTPDELIYVDDEGDYVVIRSRFNEADAGSGI